MPTKKSPKSPVESANPATAKEPSAYEVKEKSLSADEILIAEFEYISASAFQANEDRSKAASFFLVSVGSLIAAFLGAHEIPKSLYEVMSILFAALTVFGFLTIAQLARLRLAWHDAAIAMNQIKKFYTGKISGLEEAFHWKGDTLPKKFKFGSVSFYTTIEVALVSGPTAGVSAYFLLTATHWGGEVNKLAIVWGFTIFVFSLLLYIILLNLPAKKPQTAMEKNQAGKNDK